MLISIQSIAQNGLNIAEVFGHYARKHGTTMVQLSADVLKAYEMTFYKSLLFKPETSGKYGLNWVEGCIDNDKKHARKIKETLLDGNLQSGYYQLPQIEKNINRFILFKLNKKQKATLIYIEGKLSSAELVSMLFTKK
jgi:hypothetical protein